MGKASKRAQRLASRNEKASTKVVSTAPTQPTPVVAAPSVSPVQVGAPKVTVPTVAPKVVVPVVAAPTPATPTSTPTNQGVCIEVVLNRDGVPIFAKIKNGSATYIAHKTKSTVPREGDIVTFVPYKHEERDACVVVRTIGQDETVLARVKILSELPVYKTSSRERYLGASPDDASSLLLQIKGTLSSGELISLSK